MRNPFFLSFFYFKGLLVSGTFLFLGEEVVSIIFVFIFLFLRLEDFLSLTKIL